MTPVEALTRAVYLLDRGQQPPEKVAAFHRALEVIADLGPEETDARARAGTLRDIEGIGANTSEVVTAAVRDVPCTYLARLERATHIDVTEGVDLRAALRGDCRCRTTWSDGRATISEMAAAAAALGHQYLVIADPSARRTVAHGLDEKRLQSQLAEIDVLNMGLAPFRVLTGAEVNVLDDGSLDLSDNVLGALDIVVASVNRQPKVDSAAMTKRMVRAVANPHTDIVGRGTGQTVTGSEGPFSAFDAETVFAACNRYDKAVEISGWPEHQDPPGEVLDIAMAWGTKFAINSNAHAPGQLEWLAHGCERAARTDLDTDRVINTWDADQLLSWAANHPT